MPVGAARGALLRPKTPAAVTVMSSGQSHQGPPGASLPTTDPLDITVALGAGTSRKIAFSCGCDAAAGIPSTIAFDPDGANVSFTKRIERVTHDAKVSIWDADISDGQAATNYTVRIDKTTAARLGWGYVVMKNCATGAPLDSDGEETNGTIAGATITLNSVPNGAVIFGLVTNGAFSDSNTATYAWSAPSGAVDLQRGASTGGSFFMNGGMYAEVNGGNGDVASTWAHTAASGAHASIAVAYGPA